MAAKWSDVFRVLAKIFTFIRQHPELVDASIEAAKAVKQAKEKTQ